ncbi:MAG: hypothetical protein ACRD5R_15150 [Candidatus Acidiferrales bacterium]
MRTILWVGAAAILLVPASAQCQQQNQAPAEQTASAAAPASSTQSPAAAQSQAASASQDPLAAAARRARAEKKEAAKPAKVFTNDNIPSEGGISAVGGAEAGGGETAAAPGGAQSAAAAPAAGGYPSGDDEKGWRALFARLHHKLDQDNAALAIGQRELGVLNMQYYPDPTKAMMQQLTRSDINAKSAKIDEKKKEIDADNQAISDAEDALRQAGGDGGWAR